MSEMLITVPGDPSSDEYPAYNNVNVENLWYKHRIYKEFNAPLFDLLHTGAIVQSINIRNIILNEKQGFYTYEEKKFRFVVTVEDLDQFKQLLNDIGELSLALVEDACNPGRWIIEW